MASPRPARTGTSGRSATSRPGKDLPDRLKWIKFSGAEWTPDGQGFFYGRFPEPRPGEDLKGANYYQKVYYHRLGTLSKPTTVWSGKIPSTRSGEPIPHVTDDGAYLILTIEKGNRQQVSRSFIARSTSRTPKPVHLVGEFDADYTFIDNDGPVFWFKTDKNAPRGKVVAIDTRRPAPEHWVELIPEQAETLEGVDVVGRPFPGPLSRKTPTRWSASST